MNILAHPLMIIFMIIVSCLTLIFSIFLKKDWVMKVRVLAMLMPRLYLLAIFFGMTYIPEFPIAARFGILSLFGAEAVMGIIDIFDFLHKQKENKDAIYQ